MGFIEKIQKIKDFINVKIARPGFIAEFYGRFKNN